jgi:hypothetical protein
MKLIYATEPLDKNCDNPVFLVGPTPRSAEIKSWRPKAVEEFEKIGFKGSIYIPECRSGEWKHSYLDQVEWEHNSLDHCAYNGAIFAWVPRELKNMPAFTTNVEFGMYVFNDNLFYGRPNWSVKNNYLDYTYERIRYRKPKTNIKDLVLEVAKYLDERS